MTYRSEKFWDRIADRYAKRPVSDEAAYQKKLKVTRGYLSPDSELMEFGCGTGSTGISLAPDVKHIVATDISQKMIEIAQGKVETEQIDNISFERTTIEDYSAPDQVFDAVLGHNILHLLEDWEDAIARVHRMLKPGGVFITSTACLGDMTVFFKIIALLGGLLGLIPSVNVFSSKELKDCMEKTGFEIDYQWQPGKNKPVFIVAKTAS